MSHDHDHDHAHPPGHAHDHAGHGHHHHAHDHDHEAKDPAEQAELAQHLGEELTAIFVRYVAGELDFADLTFSTYDVLQDLHVIALGEYELEYGDDADDDGDEDGDEPPGTTESDYDQDAATAQQEDLAQEPSRS